MNYLNIFFFFSILGHFIESSLTKNYTSGILYGYWTPIYGAGVVLVILIDRFLQRKTKKKFKRYCMLFIISAFLISLIEYFSGIIIQEAFKKVFWNYSSHKWNIGLYTSVEMSLVWGISSIIIAYFIEPLCEKYSNKIPKWISFLLLGLFILDCLVTINNRIISF